ncbi:MAG: recombinase family protein [Kangiellaceae bacterium]|nr:recombinase family protein [Kangiellaceae bacterium]
MKLLYSYIRMSSVKQYREGDSLRRQLENTRRFAEQNGYTLDESTTFKDLGVSGFRGANLQIGALGQLMRCVREGKIPAGSALCVENFDRFSRMELWEAFESFSKIISAGIDFIILRDPSNALMPTIYSKKAISENNFLLYGSLQAMSIANLESQRKSDLLSQTWAGKRKEAKKGNRKLTSRCPGWLVLNKDKTEFGVIPDRARVVNDIFRMAINGVGKRLIAKSLNDRQVATFGKASHWYETTVAKYLKSRAVLGEYQPKVYSQGKSGRGVPDESTGVISDYFPRIVDDEIFYAAQNAIKSRQNSGGRKGNQYSNIFSGLAFCGHCNTLKNKLHIERAVKDLEQDSYFQKLNEEKKLLEVGKVSNKPTPMTFANKGKDTEQYLVCSRYRRGLGCQNNRYWNYHYLEKSILTFCKNLDVSIIADNDESNLTKIEKVNAQMSKINHEISEIEFKNGKFMAALLESNAEIPTLSSSIAKNDKKIGNLKTRLDKLKDKLGRLSAVRNVAKKYNEEIKIVFNKISHQESKDPTEVLELRAKLASLLKGVVYKIELFNNGRFDDGNKEFVIHYHNGDKTDVIPNPDDPTDYEIVRERDMIGVPIKKDRVKYS